MKKTVLIFEHKGGRLGNQLWNYASVLAYCLERGYRCKNITFKEYAEIFDTSHAGKVIDTLLKYLPGRIASKIIAMNSRHIKAKYAEQILTSGNSIGADTQTPFYLPPSKNGNTDQNMSLANAESSSSPYIYLSGWLFRNPTGMMKYQREISAYFKPNKHIHKKVASTINNLRTRYEHVIGVHIRKKDYKEYWGGRFYFTETEIRPMLDDYIAKSGIDRSKTVFVICSDEHLDTSAFNGLNIYLNSGSIGEDLFILSSCDSMIGSDSTFGAISAYLGNIPIVFFSKETIDWKVLQTPGYNYHNGSLNIQH